MPPPSPKFSAPQPHQFRLQRSAPHPLLAPRQTQRPAPHSSHPLAAPTPPSRPMLTVMSMTKLLLRQKLTPMPPLRQLLTPMMKLMRRQATMSISILPSILLPMSPQSSR